MATYTTTTEELTAIANAIRLKGGTVASLIYPSGFISAISAITTMPNLQSKTVSPSTVSISVTPDSGYGGLNLVTVNAMPAGTAFTPATTITVTPVISVNSSGVITATVSAVSSVTPTVSAGYVTSGTTGNVGVSGSNTSQLIVYSGSYHSGT